MKQKIFFIIIFILSISKATAQDNGEFGVLLGAATYQGDLNQINPLYMPSSVYGIAYRRILDKHYSLKTQVLRTVLQGDDAISKNLYQRQRGHSFQTEIIELSLQLEFNFLPVEKGSKFEKFSPFVKTGISGAIMAYDQQKFLFAIPYGLGLKFAVNKKMTISADITRRLAFSDAIDKLPQDDYTNIDFNYQKQRSDASTLDSYTIVNMTIAMQLYKPFHSCPAYGRKRN